jgi:hypothetical protein
MDYCAAQESIGCTPSSLHACDRADRVVGSGWDCQRADPLYQQFQEFAALGNYDVMSCVRDKDDVFLRRGYAVDIFLGQLHRRKVVIGATSRPSYVSLARYNSPIPPAPSGATISYGLSFVPAARLIAFCQIVNST